MKKRKSNTGILLFDIASDPTDIQMKEDGEKICPWSYYMENLFGKDDLYLYRAISHFYAQNYQEAIMDFKMCMKVKKLYKVLDNEAN